MSRSRIRRILNRRKYRERYGPRELEQLLQLRTVTSDLQPEKIHSAPWSPAIDTSAAAMDLWFAPTIAALRFAEAVAPGLVQANDRH